MKFDFESLASLADLSKINFKLPVIIDAGNPNFCGRKSRDLIHINWHRHDAVGAFVPRHLLFGTRGSDLR